MEKVYLLISESVYLMKEKIRSYQALASIDDMNVVSFDCMESELESMFQELYTISFFGDKKLVIFEHVEAFFEHDSSKLEPLISYLANPSEDIILIMWSTNLPKNSKLIDVFEKYAYIEKIKLLEGSKLPMYIKKKFDEDQYKIDGNAIQMIINRTGNQMYQLNQEIDKLKAYAFETKVIDEKAIESLVPRSLEDNIFNFSSAYLRSDIKTYMQIYEDLLTMKMQPLTIINHLYQTIYLIYQAQKLLKQGYQQENLANFLGISSGRAYHVMKEARVQTPNELERVIKELANLDLDIKSGRKDDKLGFELLLLRKIK